MTIPSARNLSTNFERWSLQSLALWSLLPPFWIEVVLDERNKNKYCSGWYWMALPCKTRTEKSLGKWPWRAFTFSSTFKTNYFIKWAFNKIFQIPRDHSDLISLLLRHVSPVGKKCKMVTDPFLLIEVAEQRTNDGVFIFPSLCLAVLVCDGNLYSSKSDWKYY